VRAFADAIRVGVENERALENWLRNIHQRVGEPPDLGTAPR
jgi:hypothetical protein